MRAPAGVASGRIFISYRREDTDYPAGWLFERLAARFGAEQVFQDVDKIQPGDDFAEVITTAVGSCHVLLALIGDQWLTSKEGRRRLEDPNDLVRLEIEAALTRNVRVIPILVGGAQLPQADELPASMAKLVRRQALELPAIGFNVGIGHLLGALDKAMTETQGPQSDQSAQLLSDDSEKDARYAGEEANHQAPGEADLKAQVEEAHPKTPEAASRAGKEQVGSAGEEGGADQARDQVVKLPPEVPDDRPTTRLVDPADQDLADQIAAIEAMDDSYDAADALIDHPADEAARILALMNPEAAAGVFAKLHDYGVAPEILEFLQSEALARILDELSPWSDESVEILESAEVRLAAATLSEMRRRHSVLTKLAPEIATVIVNEMTHEELGNTFYIDGSLIITPDPLDQFIDKISKAHGLYLMSRVKADRATMLLENIAQRSPERGDEFLREMKPGLAGRIFGEMDIDAQLGWITRIDVTASTRLLEAMPPRKAAILLKHLDSSKAQELLDRVKEPRRSYVQEILKNY